MRKYANILFASLLITLFTFPLAGQWKDLGIDANRTFKDISFGSSKVGYAISITQKDASQSLFKTENEGLNWAELTLDTNFNHAEFQSIQFISETTGFVAFRRYNKTLKNYLYKTTDGGNNWVNITPSSFPPGRNRSDIQMVDATNGYVTAGNIIFKTSDGGKNWNTVKSHPHSYLLHEMSFLSAEYGMVGGFDGTFFYRGFVYYTLNGGQNWDTLEFNKNNTTIDRVHFVQDSTMLALGSDSWSKPQVIYRSTNLGKSWDTLKLQFLADSSDAAYDLFFSNRDNGYIVTGKGKVFSTSNGGKNWTEESQFSNRLFELTSNGNTLFALGDAQTLLVRDLKLSVPLIVDHKASISVYPNPVQQGGTLQLTTPFKGAYHIVSSTGQWVQEGKLDSENQLQLQSTLPTGNYWLVGENSTTTFTVPIHIVQ